MEGYLTHGKRMKTKTQQWTGSGAVFEKIPSSLILIREVRRIREKTEERGGGELKQKKRRRRGHKKRPRLRIKTISTSSRGYKGKP